MAIPEPVPQTFRKKLLLSNFSKFVTSFAQMAISNELGSIYFDIPFFFFEIILVPAFNTEMGRHGIV